MQGNFHVPLRFLTRSFPLFLTKKAVEWRMTRRIAWHEDFCQFISVHILTLDAVIQYVLNMQKVTHSLFQTTSHFPAILGETHWPQKYLQLPTIWTIRCWFHLLCKLLLLEVFKPYSKWEELKMFCSLLMKDEWSALDFSHCAGDLSVYFVYSNIFIRRVIFTSELIKWTWVHYISIDKLQELLS